MTPASEYAVTWRTAANRLVNGRLQLDVDGFALSGSTPDGAVLVDTVAFADIEGVRIGRANGERVHGRRSLVVERRGRDPLVLVTLGEAGALLELAERLAGTAAGARGDTTVVVVPLRPGTADEARRLVDEGPPLDLRRLGLERHQVFVTAQEVVFVFEGDQPGPLRRALAGPGMARALARWRPLLAGPPRVAELRYAWSAAVPPAAAAG